jgi:hypothetical protein
MTQSQILGRNAITTDQLCKDKLAGLSLDRFYRIRTKLEKLGFPRPLPGFGEHRYDPLAVDLWFTAQMRPELRAILEQLLPEAGQIEGELRERAKVMAAGMAGAAE